MQKTETGTECTKLSICLKIGHTSNSISSHGPEGIHFARLHQKHSNRFRMSQYNDALGCFSKGMVPLISFFYIIPAGLIRNNSDRQ
jgi:hypothetical protein